MVLAGGNRPFCSRSSPLGGLGRTLGRRHRALSQSHGRTVVARFNGRLGNRSGFEALIGRQFLVRTGTARRAPGCGLAGRRRCSSRLGLVLIRSRLRLIGRRLGCL